MTIVIDFSNPNHLTLFSLIVFFVITAAVEAGENDNTFCCVITCIIWIVAIVGFIVGIGQIIYKGVLV